jgi:mRNA interferase YafQ
MRAIERTGRFKRDYKRESKGAYKNTIALDLIVVLKLLVADKALPTRYRDHPLVGE